MRAAGNEILVIEGAIPQAMPQACRVGDQAFADLVSIGGEKRHKVVALGTCASSEASRAPLPTRPVP